MHSHLERHQGMNWTPLREPVPEASPEQVSFLRESLQVLASLCACAHMNSRLGQTCLAARWAHPVSAGARAPVYTCTCKRLGRATASVRTSTEHRGTRNTGCTPVIQRLQLTGGTPVFQMSQLTRSALVGPNVAAHRMHTGSPNVADPLYVSRLRTQPRHRTCRCA